MRENAVLLTVSVQTQALISRDSLNSPSVWSTAVLHIEYVRLWLDVFHPDKLHRLVDVSLSHLPVPGTLRRIFDAFALNRSC